MEKNGYDYALTATSGAQFVYLGFGWTVAKVTAHPAKREATIETAEGVNFTFSGHRDCLVEAPRRHQMFTLFSFPPPAALASR